jgi:hypothetical protein
MMEVRDIRIILKPVLPWLMVEELNMLRVALPVGWVVVASLT